MISYAHLFVNMHWHKFSILHKKISPPSATNTQRRAEQILPISARFKFTLTH
nr:MAG TPA: hypothetical protein [Caudoviricetes sp.]